MTEFINLTSRNVRLINKHRENGQDGVICIEFPVTEKLAMVTRHMDNVIRSIPHSDNTSIDICEVETSRVINLPDYDPVKDVIYIVSRIVLRACPERVDLVAPGKAIYGADGYPHAYSNFIGSEALVLEAKFSNKESNDHIH